MLTAKEIQVREAQKLKRDARKRQNEETPAYVGPGSSASKTKRSHKKILLTNNTIPN